MQNPFVAFDSWIIKYIFEPIAWRAEYRFGFSQFWLARACMVLAGSYFCLVTTLVGSWPAVAVLLACFALAYLGVYVQEHHMNKRGNNPVRNSVNFLIMRLVIAVMMAVTLASAFEVVLANLVNMMIWPQDVINLLLQIIVILLTLAAFMCFASFFYFISCSKMPPWWRENYSIKLAQKLASKPT